MKHKGALMAGFIILLLGFVWLGGFMMFCRQVFYEEAVESLPPVGCHQGIAALTGGRNRIAKAAKLLAAGQGERLLISGVKPDITLAQIGAREDVALADDMAVDLGYEATDTVGNAREIKTWADKHGFAQITVVTSFYHIPRSRLELSRVMPEKEIHFVAVSSPFVLRRWWLSPKSFLFLAAEYTKFLFVYVQYHMLGL